MLRLKVNRMASTDPISQRPSEISPPLLCSLMSFPESLLLVYGGGAGLWGVLVYGGGRLIPIQASVWFHNETPAANRGDQNLFSCDSASLKHTHTHTYDDVQRARSHRAPLPVHLRATWVSMTSPVPGGSSCLPASTETSFFIRFPT